MDDIYNNNNNLISIGETIRRLTYELLEKQKIVKQSLNKITTFIDKKETLIKYIKEDYFKKLKIIIHFIKNCYKYNNILSISNDVDILYRYNNDIKNLINEQYNININNMLYRSIKFNIKSGVKFLNLTNKKNLKKNLFYSFAALIKSENKKNQYNIIQKYKNNEKLKENFIFEDIFKNIDFALNVQKEILKLELDIKQNNNNIYVKFKENLFYFNFNNLIVYQIMPDLLVNNDNINTNNNQSNTDDNNIFITYKNIQYFLNKKHSAFRNFKTNELYKNLNILNQYLDKNLKINLFNKKKNNNNEKNICNYDNIYLGLDLLKKQLEIFTVENVYKFIFFYYIEKIKNFLLKKFDFNTKIEYNSNNNNIDQNNYNIVYTNENNNIDNYINNNDDSSLTIKFISNIEIFPYNNLKNNMFIKFIPKYSLGKIIIIISHYILKNNPLIFLENKEEFYSIKDIPYKDIIVENFFVFKKIIINLIYEKLIEIKPFFIFYKFVLFEEEEHIDFFFVENDNNLLLFSIILNNEECLKIIDNNGYFNNKEVRDEIKNILTLYLKENKIDILKFNEIIFTNYIHKCFSTSLLNSKIDDIIFNKYNNINNINYNFTSSKFSSTNNNINLKVNVLSYNSYNIINNYFNINKIDLIISIIKNNNRYIYKINFDHYKNNKNYLYTISSLKIFYYYICDILLNNQRFFKKIFNILEYINIKDFNKSIYIEKNKIKKIILNPKEDFENILNSFDENEKYFFSSINKIEVFIENEFFKIFLNQKIFSEKCDLFENLTSYYIMDGTNILSFEKEECSLTFAFLSKLRNLDKNFFHSIFKEYIKKISFFLSYLIKFINNNIETFKNIVINDDITLSPICLLYKYEYEKKIRNVNIQYCNNNYSNFSNKYFKYLLNPFTLKFFNNKYNELENEMYKNIYKIIYESKEEELFQKFNYIFLINDVYELLSENFISFMIFNTKNTEDILNKEIFFILKDINVFEIFKKNNFGIFFNIINSEIIEIYPNFYTNENNMGNIENGTLKYSIELMINIKKYFINDYDENNFFNENEKNLFIYSINHFQNKTGKTICEQLMNVIHIIKNFNYSNINN